MSESHCCCGGCSTCGGCGAPAPVRLNAAEKELLIALETSGGLPLTRFVMVNAEEDDDVYIVALEPVYLYSTTDTMEKVKETGVFLKRLAEAGLITLDYDTPLADYLYTEYTESALFAFFVDTVREGALRPGYLADTACLEAGQIQITDLGKQSLAIS